MNDLIKITEKDGKRVVSARDLHEFLEVGRDFSTWCKQMIDYGFVEGVDFSSILVKSLLPVSGEKVQRGGSNRIEYALTIETAKHWAMMQRSEKGMEIRNYFIECEKKASGSPTTKIDVTMAFYKGASEILGLNDSSKLLMMQNLAKELDLPLSGLPSYTPSKGQLLSATDLLKRNGFELSAKAFNCLMIGAGMMEEKERVSLSKGIKKFKSLVGDGLAYGENQVSPNNPRETQALYYSETFLELMELIMK